MRGVRGLGAATVIGMHQSDLDWYVANHPNSELAKRLLGLDPDALAAVRIEGTQVLPGIDRDRDVETRHARPS